MGHWDFCDYFFQRHVAGDTVQLMLATVTAMWALRGLARKGFDVKAGEGVREHIRRFVTCPWLLGSEQRTLDKRERRSQRLQPPPPTPHDAVVYRSDGASRRQGIGGVGKAGWGSAVWETPNRPAPTACVYGHLGVASNNVAEYVGLKTSMERAVRKAHRTIVFQVDSILVERHQSFAWSCKSKELRPHYDACITLGKTLTRQGKRWSIEHIYREFNATADALANSGVDNVDEFVVEEGRW